MGWSGKTLRQRRPLEAQSSATLFEPGGSVCDGWTQGRRRGNFASGIKIRASRCAPESGNQPFGAAAAAGVFVLVAQASAEPADRPNSPSHAGNVRQFDLRVSTPQMREWAAGEIPSPILVFRNIVFLAFKKYRLN